MNTRCISRRELLIQGRRRRIALLAPRGWRRRFRVGRAKKSCHGWISRAANPSGGVVENLQPWENLAASFMTPNDKFFRVSHYDKPVIDEKKWNLEIAGLVKKPMNLTLAAIKARPQARRCVHDRMRRQPWIPVVHERDRHRQVGGYAARAVAEAGRRDGSRERSRLLGR